MVDIDEILAGAIRTAWLEIGGLNRGLLVISRSRPRDEFARLLNARALSSPDHARRAVTANFTRCRTLGTFRIRRSEREARRGLCHKVIFYKPEEDGAAAPTAGST